MASIVSLVNRLIPFATPGTPFLQDVVHLIVVCTLLYFGPQIQDSFRRAAQSSQAGAPGPATPNGSAQEPTHPTAEDVQEDVPPDNGAPPLEQNDPLIRQENDHGLPGPARQPERRREQLPAQRNIGAKKAKSLARKDQRRAYHEFQRAQGEAQRARDAEGAAEREAALAAERERRKEAQAAVEAKIAREREEKRWREQKEWEEGLIRRNQIVSVVKGELEKVRFCELAEVAETVGGGVDEVSKVLSASGMLGKKDDALTMVTSSGYVVTLRREGMDTLYEQSLRQGHSKLDSSQLSGILSASL